MKSVEVQELYDPNQSHNNSMLRDAEFYLMNNIDRTTSHHDPNSFLQDANMNVGMSNQMISAPRLSEKSNINDQSRQEFNHQDYFSQPSLNKIGASIGLQNEMASPLFKLDLRETDDLSEQEITDFNTADNQKLDKANQQDINPLTDTIMKVDEETVDSAGK